MRGVFADLEIPEVFTVTTGGEEEQLIIEQRDAFFGRVIRQLGMRATNNPFIEYHTRAISTRVDTYHEDDAFRLSNDWLHELIVCDQALALVLDRRNDYNNHQVSFFVSEPTDRLLGQIHRIQDASRDLKTIQKGA